MKKKIIGAVLAVLVLAGAAAAQGYGDGSGCRGNAKGPRREMTQQERVQHDAMRKLHQELRAELGKANPDKARARKLFEKQLAMRESFMAGRFEDCFAKGDKRSCEVRGMRGFVKESKNSRAWNDFRAEMRKESPDKARANALFKEALKENRKNEMARFEEVLKDPSKFMHRRDGRKEGARGGQRCGGSDRPCSRNSECRLGANCPDKNNCPAVR